MTSQAAQEKPTSPRTEAGRTLVQRMLSSKTDDRMGPDDLQRAILAIEREAAGKDSPATPSLDVLRKEAWKFLDHITQQDYVGERVNIDVPALDHFRSVLARLDEGSATPFSIVADSYPSQIVGGQARFGGHVEGSVTPTEGDDE